MVTDVGAKNEPVRVAAAFDDNGAAFINTVTFITSCAVEIVVRNAGFEGAEE